MSKISVLEPGLTIKHPNLQFQTAPYLFALALGAFLCGCRSREDVPYLGRWEGQFSVERLTAKSQVNDPKRNNWKGYVILYRTQDEGLGNRLQMHVENEQEGVDLKGHWTLKGRQISATFNDIKIDDAGGLDMRDPNKSYLDSADIRKVFSTPLALNIHGKTQLESPIVVFGPLLGKFEFTKATMGR